MKKITISGVDPIEGFIERGAKKGESVAILQKEHVFADDLKFYVFLNQLDSHFLRPARIDGDSITRFFILLHKDGTADIYPEYSQVQLQIKLKQSLTKAQGEVVYMSDIEDVSRCQIGDIEDNDFRADDAVICVMKVGWKYGLFFDFTRKTTAEAVWMQLGQLYNSLHIGRIIENIQNAITEEEKPHFITEGKTDWKHVEAARRVLAPGLLFGYPASEATLGEGGLLKMCEQLSKFGPHNKNKVIAIFDRDSPEILKELAKHGDIDGYQEWGNNVYSLAIPFPKNREKYKYLCIELLYSDEDLVCNDKNGRRLFFDNEIQKAPIPAKPLRWLSISPKASREYEKKIFSGLADEIEDNDGKKVGLSKAAFAQYILDGTDGFGSVQFDGFVPLLNLIKSILTSSPVKSSKKLN